MLLSLDLPKVDKPKEGKKEKAKPDSAPKKEEGKTMEMAKEEAKTGIKAELEKEKAALEKRKAEAVKKSCSQAATYEKAGIAFGFSTIETKPNKVMDQVRVMIDHGLSEAAALKALTTTPAEMLGLSSVMGTVEKGKMANLLVSDKPVFEEKSNIRYVFVDGNKFAMEAKAAKKKSSGGAAGGASLKAVVGTWSFETNTPQGKQGGVLTLKDEGGSLEGNIKVQSSPEAAELSSASLEGNVLSFSFSFEVGGGQQMSIDCEVTIDGDTFDGTMSVGEFGSFPLEGEKTSSPE